MAKLPWWAKQKGAVGFLEKRGGRNACLFMDPGTGKTRVMIRRVETLIREGAKLIYVANTIAGLYVWINEWEQWGSMPMTFIDLQAAGEAGLHEALKLAEGGWPVICLVNYESAWRIGRKRETYIDKNGNEKSRLKEVGLCMDHINWDIGILDESTAIKTPGSSASKFFRLRMQKKTKYRYPLTGTAYTKRPLNVWAPIKFATGNEIFPETYTAFKQRYAIPHPYIRGAIVGYQNLEELVGRMAKAAVLLKIEDVTDIPPRIHQTRLLDLSKKSKAIYDEITQEGIVQLEDFEKSGGVVTAEHVFALQRKQQQITSGFIKLDSDDPKDIRYERLGTEKLDELIDLLKERDDPTLIVTQANEEERIIAEAIEKEFGFVPKILNGSVKGGAAREQMRLSAQKDLAFIVKQSVACKSLDLRFSDLTIFYSHTPRTEDYEQMLRRNARGGQTKTVRYVHLICRKTADVRVMKIIEQDLKIAAEIDRGWKKLLAAA